MLKFFILAMVLTVTTAQMLSGLSAMLGSLTKLGGNTGQQQLPGYSTFGGKPGPSSSQSNPFSSLGIPGAGRRGGFGGIMRMMGGRVGPGMQKLMQMRITRMLCKEAEGRKLPCFQSPRICEMNSWTQYKMPGLLECSPLGVGCCFKNLHMMHVFNK